ncbi:MAG: hypothetical protein CTY25_12055 [Methylobacterium sp.]|nr:MAG: hypothetical protein CTY25_12055 [Methylobacterium sp.]
MSAAGNGLMIKKLPPPKSRRVGSFEDSIEYAMRGIHDVSVEMMPDIIPDIVGQEAKVVDSHGIADLRTAAREMDAQASLSKVEDPVVHLNFLYGNGRPTAGQIRDDIRRVKDAIDMAGHQHIAILHSDKAHNWHLHVIANRVGPDGIAATLSHDYARMENLATRINWERGWDLIAGNHNGKLIKELAAMTRADIDAEKAKENGHDKGDQARGKSLNRDAVRRAKRIRERGPRKPQSLDRSRLRSLSECRMARDGGRDAATVLQIDVSARGREDRRVRTLDADARRVERELERNTRISSTAKQAAETRGVIPWQDIAGPIIQAAFARHETYAAFAEELAEKGIEVALTDIPGKVPGVAFRSPLTNEGCSGTKAGVPRKALAEKFSDVVHVDVRIQDVDIRDRAPPEVAETITRNRDFRADYDQYRKVIAAQNAALRETAKAHAWTQEQIRRSRLFARIRRYREFRDAFIRSFYGRKKRNRFAKNLLLKASAKWAEYGRTKAFAKNAARWKETKARLFDGLPIEKPKDYLDWLLDQPRSAQRDAEIAAITRKAYKAPDVVIVAVETQPQRDAIPPVPISPPEPKPEPKIDEKKQKPAPTPEHAAAAKNVVEQLFDAWRDGQLDAAMEAAMRRTPADRDKIIAVRNLFARPLGAGSEAKQAVERDKRKRAAAIIVERGWTEAAALDEIDQIDRSRKSRQKPARDKSWGKKGRDDGKGGIGD